MIRSLMDNRECLRNAIKNFSPNSASAATLLEMSHFNYFGEYIKTLEPIAQMVLELQVNVLVCAYFLHSFRLKRK